MGKVPLIFLFAKAHLAGWRGGERPLYTVSKVFVCLYITRQIFLWIPYSECFVIHNEGSCRNGGGGTDNPSGILLCSKGHLVESCPGMHI